MHKTNRIQSIEEILMWEVFCSITNYVLEDIMMQSRLSVTHCLLVGKMVFC